MFDFELNINRPQNALEAIKNKIIADVKSRYENVSIEVLHESYKSLLESLEVTKVKIERLKDKSITIEKERAEHIKTWNSFTKSLQALCKKHKINLQEVSVPHATGLEFAEQIANSKPNIATFDGEKIPQSLDTSKLDDLEEKLYEIKISLKLCESERLKKAQIIKEILESA